MLENCAEARLILVSLISVTIILFGSSESTLLTSSSMRSFPILFQLTRLYVRWLSSNLFFSQFFFHSLHFRSFCMRCVVRRVYAYVFKPKKNDSVTVFFLSEVNIMKKKNVEMFHFASHSLRSTINVRRTCLNIYFLYVYRVVCGVLSKRMRSILIGRHPNDSTASNMIEERERIW